MQRRDVKDPHDGHPDAAAAQVARFYEDLVFPSRGSHAAYTELLPTAAGERIGDFGCGQSIFHEALRGYVPAPTFLDRSWNALRTIEHGGRVRADLAFLPFPDSTFDRVFCIGVLHHLPQREAIWREVARILRPGGRFVVGVYAPGSLPSRLRRLYAASPARPWKTGIFKLTEAMIRARYAKRGLPSHEAQLRARDFLDVPYVQYSPPEIYVREAESCGLRRQEVRRIAAMNVLTLRRA